MKLVDKIKNMFTEEVEEPVIKKEVMKVEIESPVVEEESIKEDIKVEEKIEKPSPVFFDDEDFEALEKPKVEEKIEKPIETFKEKYKGNKEESKKVFRPSPIISPVYGVLDKNYKKEDLDDNAIMTNTVSYEHTAFTVDEVRKKAYGTLEDDVEVTLFGTDEPKHEKKDEIEDLVTDDKINEFDLSDERTIEDYDSKNTEDDFDLSDDIMNSYQDEPEEKEVTDEDLFNLIDSMYEEEEK